MLAWINAKAVIDLRDAFSKAGPTGVRIAPILHNQAGISARWVMQYMRGESVRDTGERSRQSMWDLAHLQWTLTNLLAEVRSGARGFDVHHGVIRLQFVGDRKLDALDRMLDVMTEVHAMKVEGRPHGAALLPWLDRGGRNIPWHACPDHVVAHYRSSARALIESYPKYLPDDLDVGGFTIQEATEVLTELLAAAQHSQACVMRGSVSAAAITPTYSGVDFISTLSAASSVPGDRVGTIVNALTMNTEASIDPCLTPIIPIDESLAPMSSLIAPGSPVRNLTIVLQQDTTRFGEAGKAIGRLGVDECRQTLSRLAGCRLATNVALVSEGRKVGDLDVVVLDSARRLMVVFEVTWQLAPDGSAEIGKAVGKAIAKRKQVARNRSQVESGSAHARVPADWPDFSDYTKRWFIVTRDVLPLTPAEDEIVIRSHQMLAWMLKDQATIEELIDLLDNPPTPPGPLDELIEAERTYGDIRVTWNQVAI